MSDTLQYLRSTADSAGNAAQSFLNKKLAQNKYSATPDIDYDKGIIAKDVEAHNRAVADPYAMGEGTVATGPAYPNPGGSGGDKKRKGSMSADELRSHFGLEYDGNADRQIDQSLLDKGRMQDDEGNMWYHDTEGKIKYLGKVSGGYKRGRIGQGSDKEAKNKSDKSMFHAGDDDKKGDHHRSSNELLQWAHDDRQGGAGNHDNGFNSINDVANAMRHLLGKGSGKEVGRKPIKHSPEIRQAKSRVKEYEERAWSGEMSNDIFGGANAADPAKDYRFEATEGLDGIGTAGGVEKDSGADKSTASFLNKKKEDVKKEYNFQPAS
jgi:hypothetical protein